MPFFCYSVSLAEVSQELVYQVLQKGVEVGKRTVEITYLPSSKSSPWGGKKIDFHSDIQLNIAGMDVHYVQRGAALFSSNRSSFVVSNQINEDLIEMQGQRSSAGKWIVYSISNGTTNTVEYPSSQAQDISIEMFGVENWMEGDPLSILFVDGTELYNINTVWSEGSELDTFRYE